MNGQQKEYITSTLNPFLKDIISAVLIKKPDDPTPFMIEWLHKKLGVPSKQSEKEELRLLRQEVARLKAAKNAGSEGEASESNDDDEVDDEDIMPKSNPELHRSAVSAEAYGKWNKKTDFIPRVIKKTEEQVERLLKRLNNSFMFASLDEKDKAIVVSAMEEKRFQAKDIVIRQGDDGKELFVVGSGLLKCYKKIKGEEKFLKDYHPGEAFGELALLYNAPRAATIIVENECELWSLDRECFNHIVKDAAIRRRERYEDFLSKIEILQDMDPYERSQLADVLKSVVYKTGDYVIHEGDEGNVFFIVEEGTAVALKVLHVGQDPVEVKAYSSSDYFGELALIKNAPRAASILATSELKCVSLDRHSFKRLLGPLEDILKRNAQKYDEIVAKKSLQ
ncbi:hypothetical protein SteCoe_21768 [Stentor coeruleus]|uniref:cAMP-dependent protein kinase regulatory subunit n=1 Tax=Stentor coeruleus TaxID=5963 RepID=A0A1R2BNT8_9CILI|nr:hypothetical protein SteCoe_21768 [Stentor coeruleus]